MKRDITDYVLATWITLVVITFLIILIVALG